MSVSVCQRERERERGVDLPLWTSTLCDTFFFQFFSPLSKVRDEPENGTLEMMETQNNHRSKESSFVNMAAGANEDATHRVGPDERAPLLPL